MKPWVPVAVIATVLAYGGLWLHFHDIRVRHDATLNRTSDSLKTERRKSHMFLDSLKEMERVRDDSLANLEQRHREDFRKSQEYRVGANHTLNELKRRLRAMPENKLIEMKDLDSLDYQYNQALALKDSVIANRDQAILLYQRLLKDRDLAILRLNSDIAAAVKETDQWKHKAGQGTGIVHDVTQIAKTTLAAYGGFHLLTGR